MILARVRLCKLLRPGELMSDALPANPDDRLRKGCTMPEQRQVAETYWSVCWKWIFPYPCRKTRIVTRWCYDFSYLHVSYRYVYTIYQGCELNILYRWRKFELTWSGDDFTLYFLTKCF